MKIYVNNTNGVRDTLCDVEQSENFSTLLLPLLQDDPFRFSHNG